MANRVPSGKGPAKIPPPVTYIPSQAMAAAAAAGSGSGSGVVAAAVAGMGANAPVGVTPEELCSFGAAFACDSVQWKQAMEGKPITAPSCPGDNDVPLAMPLGPSARWVRVRPVGSSGSM